MAKRKTTTHEGVITMSKANSTPDTGEQQVTVSVVLKQSHTHAGRDYPAGETITVSASAAAWLIKHNVGVMAEAETPAS
jgi:hypothetical protein